MTENKMWHFIQVAIDEHSREKKEKKKKLSKRHTLGNFYFKLFLMLCSFKNISDHDSPDSFLLFGNCYEFLERQKVSYCLLHRFQFSGYLHLDWLTKRLENLGSPTI